MDTDFLDWALTDFSGYVAADELYDGPFCILSRSVKKFMRSCRQWFVQAVHDRSRQMADDTMNAIRMNCGKIVTRDHEIMEEACLLAFWSPPRDQQVGRVIGMQHVCRDLGNNRIVQTPIVSIILDDQRWAAGRAMARRKRIQDKHHIAAADIHSGFSSS